MRAILLILVGLSISWGKVAVADPEWYRNTQFLPQYCKDRAKGGKSLEYNKWRSTLGDVYIHMHHYCNGLYAQTMARTAFNKANRNRLLADMIGEMQYVGRHCNSRCVLYPELHSHWGWALGEQGQIAEAIQHYNMAIKAKPKYTPAYAQLSELYKKNKQAGEARKVLEAGLKAVPNSRSLQRLLNEL